MPRTVTFAGHWSGEEDAGSRSVSCVPRRPSSERPNQPRFSGPRRASSEVRTSAVFMPMCERKPNAGMRFCSGSWPPSKPWPDVAAGTRALALVATAGRLAASGGDAAANALFRFLAAWRPAARYSSGLSRHSPSTCEPDPHVRPHFQEVAHLVNHAAHRRRVLELALRTNAAQTQADHARTVLGQAAPRATSPT